MKSRMIQDRSDKSLITSENLSLVGNWNDPCDFEGILLNTDRVPFISVFLFSVPPEVSCCVNGCRAEQRVDNPSDLFQLCLLFHTFVGCSMTVIVCYQKTGVKPNSCCKSSICVGVWLYSHLYCNVKCSLILDALGWYQMGRLIHDFGAYIFINMKNSTIFW